MSPAPTLLVVEDEESDILFLKRAVAKAGIAVSLQVAENGKKAVDYLAGTAGYGDRTKHPMPTHLLLDLKLPEMSGFEVLEWVRGEPSLKEIRVVILTSSSEESDLHRADSLGVDAYLVKPMSFALLQEIVRSIDEWMRTGRIPSMNCQVTERTVRPGPGTGSNR